VLDDVIKVSLTGVVLANRIRPHQPGTATSLKLIVSPPKPVNAVVRSAGCVGVTAPDSVKVCSAELFLHFVFGLIWRVSDDHIRGRPVREEGVVALYVCVKIVLGERTAELERQITMFGKPAFASLSQRNALRKHQGDPRQFYRERVSVNAIELPGAKQ